MKKRLLNRRPHCAPGLSRLWMVPAVLATGSVCHAQDTPPVASPKPPVVQNIPPATDTPPQETLTPDRPGTPPLNFEAEGYNKATEDGNFLATGNVSVTYSGVTITADRAEGNLKREVVFSGNAKIVARGITSLADAIHFFPRERSYRLDNPRAIVEPSVLEGKLLEPLRIRGGTLRGTNAGYGLAAYADATTCIEERPHYELRVASAELIPNRRLTLKRVGVYFFGQRLIVLPTLIIPLDRRAPSRPRPDYLPEFGRNLQEGYYARFPYTFAIGSAAAAFLRLDLTELQGTGYRIEQEYLAGKQDSLYNTNSPTNASGGGFNFLNGGNGNIVDAYGYGSTGQLPRLGIGLGPTNGGLFTMQGYLKDGFNRNFNASFRHQQGIGSNNRIGFSTELQKNGVFSFSDQTNQNTRFNFAHSDGTHGVNAELSAGIAVTNSTSFSTNQITANYRHTFDFATLGANRNNLKFDFDFSRYVTESFGNTSRTARLNSQVEFRHASRDYSFSLQGNKTSPIGPQADNSAFGTLERLPELQFSANTFEFKRGWLRRVPAQLDFGYGQYSEPGSNVNTSRTLVGVTVQEFNVIRGRTEVVTGGGFEQRIYGDGAAQYILRNTTRLRQRLGGRSGFDLNYQYQEPAGGTPFLFDTFGRTHFLSAEGGYLNDPRFQITARAGYDFLGTSVDRPWQSVSTRLMWRPNRNTRLDSLATFDPNTGRFFSFSNSLRLRGRNDFTFDLLTRYDPQSGRFAQVNGQFDIPLGRTWRLASLIRYNGFNGRFESTNLQLTKRWDCLEASLTYTETPTGFRADRQFYFALRITAFPFFRAFGRSPAGAAISPGLGDLY